MTQGIYCKNFKKFSKTDLVLTNDKFWHFATKVYGRCTNSMKLLKLDNFRVSEYHRVRMSLYQVQNSVGKVLFDIPYDMWVRDSSTMTIIPL